MSANRLAFAAATFVAGSCFALPASAVDAPEPLSLTPSAESLAETYPATPKDSGAVPELFAPRDLAYEHEVMKAYGGPTRMVRVGNPSMGQGPTEQPIFLAEAALAEEKPNIHGFIDVPFKTAYVTPRGLVVENQGLVIQPVGGIIIPLGDLGDVKNFTFITGVWNSINTNQNDTNVGPWNEMDYFASFSGAVGDFSMTLTYGAWSFPQSTVNKPSTEHNLDLKISFADKGLWGGDFAINPYVDIWWAISGSSTVVLGREGGTGYLEFGIVPSYVLKTSKAPITFTFPVYFSVGPEDYWDVNEDHGNFGVVSGSINASMPLWMIPTRYGNWNATLGFTYMHLLNGALLDAGTILSGNDDRNVFVGSIGIGMNF